jgi:integrase
MADQKIGQLIAEMGGIGQRPQSSRAQVSRGRHAPPTPPGPQVAREINKSATKISHESIDFQNISGTLMSDRAVSNFSEAAASAMAAIRPLLSRLSAQASDGQGMNKISRQTMDAYRDRAMSLLDRFSNETGALIDEAHMPVLDFTEWFLKLKFQVSPSTWRSYRSAVLFYLSRMPGDDPVVATATISSTATDDDETSSTKLPKRILEGDFDKILWVAQKSGSNVARELSNFMRAEVRCGLRPAEWGSSEIRFIKDAKANLGRQVWLFVCNAKFSNGRANGPIRAIDLSHLDDNFIDPILATIKSAHLAVDLDGNIENWNARLRATMAYYCKKAGSSKIYSPYVLRHQAIANWKSVYSPIMVAALAGHAVPETAATHYGLMRDAWSSGRLKNLLVLPSNSDIANIESRISSHNRNIELEDGGEIVVPEDFIDRI